MELRINVEPVRGAASPGRFRQTDRIASRHASGGAKLACILLLLTTGLLAQQVTLSLRTGEQVVGEVTGLSGEGASANLVVRTADAERTWPLAQLIALHGRGPIEERAAAIAMLVGGDRVTGQLRGGDAAGESLTIASRSLGSVTVAVDRLRVVLFPARAGEAGADDLVLPEGEEEALFRRAERGFDKIAGTIHRFNDDGVLFEWSAVPEPRQYAYDTLAGIAVRGGQSPPAQPASLLTRSGDVLGGRLRGVTDGALEFVIDGDRTLRVPIAEVACLTFLGDDRVFLADLQPERVEEHAHDLGDAAPLHSWQRNRSAVGGFLQVDGLGYGAGIGVAGRSTLVFRVPQQCRRFLVRVGIDAAASRLEVRGQVVAQIRIGDKIVWGPTAVRGGDAAHDVALTVAPGDLLSLESDLGGGWFLGDWLDWANAVFLRE